MSAEAVPGVTATIVGRRLTVNLDPHRRCPHCHAQVESSGRLVSGLAPRPDDWTICGNCGGVGVYVVSGPPEEGLRVLTLRAPTAAEQVAADADPRIAAARTALAATPDSRAALFVWRELTTEPGEEVIPREQ